MSCEKRLEGKVALVTGGARGIGKAISARLAAEGAKLAIVDIMLDVAQATADEFSAQGIEARAYAANVAKFEDAENTVAAVVRDFGRLDILVNNAGITKDTLMLKMTEDMWDAVIAVNLKGTFNFTKAAVRPMMKQRAGKIVNIAFAVPAAFVFGDHLGFTAGYDAAMLGPVIAAKLTGGVLAVLAALLFTRKKPAQNM
mgnify:CR=1 FL=1